MKTIQKLCQTAVVLEAGKIKCRSDVDEAMRAYSESMEIRNTARFHVDDSRPSISSVTVDSSELDQGNLIVDITFKSPFPLSPPVAGLVISSSLGTPVFGSNPRFHNNGFGEPKLSEGVLRMKATNLPVHGGVYRLSVWLGDWHADYDEKRDVLAFEFKNGHPATNVPNPETIGFTDISANWSVLKNGHSHEH
jgi:lipopolysaccharide transport system ATP-binding protein